MPRIISDIVKELEREILARGIKCYVLRIEPGRETVEEVSYPRLMPVAEQRTRPERVATQCEEDILAILADTGHRLVTDQILSELAKHGMIHGDSTVKMALARMTKPEDGRLTQDPNANPRGYGLPESDSK